MLQDPNIFEEDKIILLLAEDSEYAFQLLFDRHRNRIYKLALRYLKSPLIAQEIVHDVFLKLWFERKNLRKGSPVEAWLFTVAKNHIINQLKRIANEWRFMGRQSSQELPDLDSVYDKIQDDHNQVLLREAINQLSDKQREVYLLAREKEMSYTTIAAELNISPLTVKTHMSRALDTLRSYLRARGAIPLLCFAGLTDLF